MLLSPGPFSKNLSKWTLAFVLIALGCFLLYTLRDFIDAFLGALIFYVLFRPLMRYLCDRRKWGRGWAASAVLLISFLVVLLPVFLVCYMMVPKIAFFFSDTSMIMQTIKNADERIRSLTGIQMLTDQNIRSLQVRATDFITVFLSESVSILITIGVMYMVLFYMLKNFSRMESAVIEFIPFNKKNIREFTHELKAQTYSNALGAPLYGLLQGGVAALGYWAVGLNEPGFWGVMTGFFSFVPVVGSTAIWLPASVYIISSGHTWNGIALIIYGLLIISLVDNVFLMIFQRKFANVHPLVTILGFIFGVSWFGIPGIIFGPLLISYFLILLKIYKEEFIDNVPAASEEIN